MAIDFPHIKAHQLYGSQIGLTEQYYDDKWNNFAKVIEENRDWNKAEQLKVHGHDKEIAWCRPSRHSCKHGKSSSYIPKSGKSNEAEQLEVQVMDMMKKLLGADHLNTLRSMQNLAVTYHSQGKWDEAEQLYITVRKSRMRQSS